jgi:hypothetical protein
MAYLTESAVLARASQVPRRMYKSAREVLSEARADAEDRFDIFLSHSTAEPEDILLGVKALLEDRGLTVYVDKYGDPHLSPDRVTPETAEVLRRRMRQSAALLYVYSQHSQKSRWMPWELGYFDALSGKVGIIPVTRNREDAFKGEEYLNLYPYVDITNPADPHLWINRSIGYWASLDGWARGVETIRKRS